MNYFKNLSKETYIVYSIFIISIIIGILVGANTEWFRPAFSNAGYMAGSLMSCLLLFSIYQTVSYFRERRTGTNEASNESN
ncbi:MULTISPECIES: hypothetical protein [Bacillaceae]|uniref:Uncharacterized protein n=1 Tax=Evansella alkalicola TaxID=745819 RepID=A0ABS6JQT8_9BACI|nr:MULTISPECIES: hypothetical protein [Bacillaceae]MBU9720843.1 hypothetical protein [Bacillus alkalicola]